MLAMAVTASNEIKKPLSVLQLDFSLLEESLYKAGLTEKQQKFLAKMKKSINKIQVLLKKFTDSTSIRFANYVGTQRMVVFDEEEK